MCLESQFYALQPRTEIWSNPPAPGARFLSRERSLQMHWDKVGTWKGSHERNSCLEGLVCGDIEDTLFASPGMPLAHSLQESGRVWVGVGVSTGYAGPAFNSQEKPAQLTSCFMLLSPKLGEHGLRCFYCSVGCSTQSSQYIWEATKCPRPSPRRK